MKAIILARVSTEDQMKEGQSLPAQLERSRQWCKNKQLDIKSEYQFDESSTKDHRKKFEQVLEEIKQTKERVALVVETIDRLQRSFRESIVLLDLIKADKVEVHFIRENLIIHKESNSSEFLRWDMGVMFARGYVLQLGDNVKRTIEKKLRNGEWPGPAPFGYRNTKDENGIRTIIPDPERAHFAKMIFEKYITGTSTKLLAEELKRIGCKSKNDKYLSHSMVYHILCNPFCYGVMRTKGKEYEHKYEPIISKNTFLRAREARLSWKKEPFKHQALPFIFRGLIRCNKCGCAVTAEIKGGKYIYYSCTNYKKMCRRIYIPEEKLLKPVYIALKSIQLDERRKRDLIEDLQRTNDAKAEYHNSQLKRLDRQYIESQQKADKFLELLAKGVITEEVYKANYQREKDKQEDILIKKEQFNDADKEYHSTASKVLSLAQRALEIFENSETTEKREFLNYLLQKCRLDGRNLVFTLRNPFDEVAKYASQPIRLPG